MVSLSSKGTTFFLGLFGLGRIKVVLSSIFLRKNGYISLNISSFVNSTFSTKISDSSSEISASYSCKLCRLASFGTTHTSLLFFFFLPYLVSLESDSLFWILEIRYGLCTGHLNTDRGEAACFQKLPTTIKRQYNPILPKSAIEKNRRLYVSAPGKKVRFER